MQVWLIIVVSFCILYYIIPQKHVGWLFLAVTLALSVMAFNCVPKVTDDLSNYYWQLSFLRNSDWHSFQQMLKNNEHNWGSLPVCGYYFYFISKLGNNGYLPAITIFIVYGSAFYVFYKASVRFKIGKLYLFLCCMFFLSTYWFYDVCSGIRNGLAFTLFIGCAYQELVEKKHRLLCVIGYLFCVGMHSATIVLAFIRCALLFTAKYGSRIFSLGMVLSIAAGGNFLIWVGEHSENSYFQLLSVKAEGNMGRLVGFGDTTQVYVNVIVFSVTVVWSLYFSKCIKEFDKCDEFNDFYKLYTVLMFFVGGCLTSGLLFVRMVRWVIPVIGPLVFMLGMQIMYDNNKQDAKCNVQTVIRTRSLTHITNTKIIYVLFIFFTAVHLWYACNGTSLIWLKFS